MFNISQFAAMAILAWIADPVIVPLDLLVTRPRDSATPCVMTAIQVSTSIWSMDKRWLFNN